MLPVFLWTEGVDEEVVPFALSSVVGAGWASSDDAIVVEFVVCVEKAETRRKRMSVESDYSY